MEIGAGTRSSSRGMGQDGQKQIKVNGANAIAIQNDCAGVPVSFAGGDIARATTKLSP